MKDPRYTIAVCNYNMEDTIGQALESMLTQVDQEFEVLVVDGASTDDSVRVVRELQTKHDNLRLVQLPPDDTRHLGADRNVAVREANGEYVLMQLDADDFYETGIVDFVEIFHQLDDALDFDFYLKGSNINVARREFLIEMGPYRNLPYGGEDLDLWRRLLDRDAVVWFDHDEISHEIHPSDGTESEKSSDTVSIKRVKRSFGAKVAEFQTGISLRSYLLLGLSLSWRKTIWYLLICPVAYVFAQTRDQYDLPTDFREKGTLNERIEAERRTLSEIESHYGVRIDRDELSQTGRDIFLDD